jgi:rare lipoprotein A
MKPWHSLVFLFLTACVVSGLGCATTPRFRTGGGDLLGIASYYADKYHGRKTANGETFDMHAMTAAHKTLPFDTRIRVTNMNNGKQVDVRINDRGPFVKGRILDLSLGAAKKLDMIGTGTAPVRIEILEMGEGGYKHDQ